MLLFATASAGSLVTLGFHVIYTVFPRAAVAFPVDGAIRGEFSAHAVLPLGWIASR